MLTYISNSTHYKEVLSRVLHVKESLWIGTADIKDLYIEDGKLYMDRTQNTHVNFYMQDGKLYVEEVS